MQKNKSERAGRAQVPSGAAGRRGKADTIAAFPIVGIGASAGGLEAFTELLAHLPLDTGMGFVLVQHLDPAHESALVQLLGRVTKLPVSEVTQDLRVEPNSVYVIPPNTTLRIAKGVLKLERRRKSREPHRSIDLFFESLAHDQRERAIGVVLSGTATDGTLGLEAIKAEGGITFAQDESARYDSMPRSALAAGCVDFVLPPSKIASELASVALHPHVTEELLKGLDSAAGGRKASVTADEADPSPVSAGRRSRRQRVKPAAGEIASGPRARRRPSDARDSLSEILVLLRNHSTVDFSLYKPSTMERRITRRMAINKQTRLEDYARFLEGNTRELDALYSDALISVTRFFRNEEAFDILQRKVMPKLLKHDDDEPVRVWVPGCSTGQEAYSIAMAFVEAAEKAGYTRQLQIFATDLNETLLERARRGLYAKSLVCDISPVRLRRFFVEEDGGYRIGKPLREMIVFARQNLFSDPPFSRMDIVSCRNLLIYLEPSLQKRVFPILHYALKPGGLLFLGASESIGGFGELFEPVDRKNRIYAKKGAPSRVVELPVRRARDRPPPLVRSRKATPKTVAQPRQGEQVDGLRAEQNAQREADRVTIDRYAPSGVLIDEQMRILQFRGPTGAYLEPPTGKASFDLLKMAREGLMLPLRAAINKAKKESKVTRKENVRVERSGRSRTVNLEVIPLRNLREPRFLVLFEDASRALASAPESERSKEGDRGPHQAPASSGGRSIHRAESPRRIALLEREIAETRDYLDSLQEQNEATNAELQASSEEIQSANEEFQSLNEELETSKEELESTNEELITVNEEMINRNAELSRLNSDLVNVQTSAHLAIVLLGLDLAIRRFSAQAGVQLNLLATDLGRPFGHVRHGLDLPDVEALVEEVIGAAAERQREVQDRGGRWFSLRVSPYLTPEGLVDGAVLVLVDIDALKRSELAVAAGRDYADHIIATVRQPLLVLDAQLRVERANRSFFHAFGGTAAKTTGRYLYELNDGQWDNPKLRKLLQEILPQRSTLENFQVEQSFERLGDRTLLLNARRIHDPTGRSERVLLSIEDITERKRAAEALEQRARELQRLNEQLREGEAQFRALAEASPALIWRLDPEGHTTYVNPRYTDYFGGEVEDVLGEGWRLVLHPDDASAYIAAVALAQHDRVELRAVVRVGNQHQQWRWLESFGQPVFGAQNEYLGHVGVSVDVTERKMFEVALAEADVHKNEFLAMLAHELRNPLAPLRSSVEIVRRVTAAWEPAGEPGVAPGPGALERNAERGVAMTSAVGMMQRQIDQMVRLIDDLLDVSRISQGKMALHIERTELLSVVREAVEVVGPRYASAGLELLVALPSEPIHLDADPTRLAQIVGNLLNNACKFTDRGGRVWLTVDGGRATRGRTTEVVIKVRDSGIGIASEELPRIFDMFAQVDASLDRSTEGLGIGLALVRTLVELHGGTVEVRSDGAGRGAEFVVRLPTVEAPVVEPPAVAPGAPVERLRILVVDDNRDAAESLAMLLQLSGHETHTAFDGLEAVGAAAKLEPDVVLLDIGLPKIDGFEVARRIREQRNGKRPVLVALTGWGQDQDRLRSEDAGFDAHLVKPVDHVALGRLLAELKARPTPPAARVSEA